MNPYKKDFLDCGDVIWLNAASEGPLPNVSAEALKEAVYWKSAVHLLDIPKFIKIPLELKKNIAQLLNVDYQDVILGTSASYGLHILANGISWQQGDEVLLMQNDFPSNILPWLALSEKGVTVKQLKPESFVVSPDQIIKTITPKTKLICLSHVHTFSGHMIDVSAIAKICRENQIKFVLNIAQSLGTMPIDIQELDVDAVVAVGYKWLCGPYGTGFCWIKEDLRESLDYNRAYWTSYLTEEDLKSEDVISVKNQKGARKYDVFATANFFNFVPLTASLQYWLDIGIENVMKHNQLLMKQLISEIDQNLFHIISPQDSKGRSNLFVFSHKDYRLNEAVFERLKDNKIFSAFWKGNIRLTPHIYNDNEQIDKTIKVLNSYA